MAEYRVVEKDWLDQMANAIRSKTGSDELMPREAFIPAVEGISGGGEIEVIPLNFQPGYISGGGAITPASAANMEVTSNHIKDVGDKLLILYYETGATSKSDSWFACGYWKDGKWVSRQNMATLMESYSTTEKRIVALVDGAYPSYPRDEICVSFRTYGVYKANMIAIDRKSFMED